MRKTLLTDIDIKNIINEHSQGAGIQKLCKKYKVSQKRMMEVIQKKDTELQQLVQEEVAKALSTRSLWRRLFNFWWL